MSFDSTGHPLHSSGRRLSEYEWPENQPEGASDLKSPDLKLAEITDETTVDTPDESVEETVDEPVTEDEETSDVLSTDAD